MGPPLAGSALRAAGESRDASQSSSTKPSSGRTPPKSDGAFGFESSALSFFFFLDSFSLSATFFFAALALSRRASASALMRLSRSRSASRSSSTFSSSESSTRFSGLARDRFEGLRLPPSSRRFASADLGLDLRGFEPSPHWMSSSSPPAARRAIFAAGRSRFFGASAGGADAAGGVSRAFFPAAATRGVSGSGFLRRRAAASSSRNDGAAPRARRLCGNQIFNPTSMCAYATVSTHGFRLCFENSMRAIDSSKNQPNRLRYDRDREF